VGGYTLSFVYFAMKTILHHGITIATLAST
jgi:hypothetical protein